MRILLIIIALTVCLPSISQIAFEIAYDSASTINGTAKANQLMLVNFELSGERYVRINRKAKTIDIYDLSHSLVKTISLAAYPTNPGNKIGDVLYLSEQLFDTDPAIELMYIYNLGCGTGCPYTTQIYKENGSVIFSDTGAAIILINTPLQQFPIYNTSQGTKMILSYSNDQAKVFSLPGTLTTAIQTANQNLMEAQGLLSNPAPNPVLNTTRIEYKLPDKTEQGELVFYDLQGIEVKRFKVDKTFDHLLISTAEIPAGTYYYRLEATGVTSPGKKMVVIK